MDAGPKVDGGRSPCKARAAHACRAHSACACFLAQLTCAGRRPLHGARCPSASPAAPGAATWRRHACRRQPPDEGGRRGRRGGVVGPWRALVARRAGGLEVARRLQQRSQELGSPALPQPHTASLVVCRLHARTNTWTGVDARLARAQALCASTQRAKCRARRRLASAGRPNNVRGTEDA